MVIKPSTLLRFHQALMKRKYRRLFSSRRRGRPGPQGPSTELISTIVAIKQRNPRYGCPRIALIISNLFGVPVDKDVVRRVLAKPALCRMFNQAVSQMGIPRYLSSDNDPLYTFQRWRVNLRILGIEKIKSIPYAPISHPFIERLIGTVRREYLDHVLFWNASDLERKLNAFKDYYNGYRVHSSLQGITPHQALADSHPAPAQLDRFAWVSHCRGLFQTPVAV